MHTIDTDVLVIGGGAAGMRAAIAARQAGLNVALLYKGGGNCTAVAAGGFAAVLPQTGTDSMEKHFENTLANGKGLANEKLVRILVQRGPAALQTILSWGVKFYTHADGTMRPFRSGGHSEPRTYRCLNGNVGQFFRSMSRRMLDIGVVPLRNYTVMNLIRHGGRVCGACGVDSHMMPFVVRAKSVVLATGGFGGAYKCTTNPQGITGEGYEMGYEAGCTLADLEFVQFMPTTFAYPEALVGKIINDTLRGEGAVMRNGSGERFMSVYDPVYGDMAGRDILSLAIALEVAAGRGTAHKGVYLDAKAVAPHIVSESFGGTAGLLRMDIDPSRDMLEVTPSVHFTCGGIVIDEQCGTGVEGLFAVGEVSAGIHGANRLGANALTETLVFGEIAGEAAASYAAEVPTFLSVHDALFESYVKGSAKGVINTQKLCSALEFIRTLFWDAVGVVRSEEPLHEAETLFLDKADDIMQEPAGLFTLQENIQRERLAKMARLGAKVARAARLRRESRGTHYRTDFAKLDGVYNRHFEFKVEPQ